MEFAQEENENPPAEQSSAAYELIFQIDPTRNFSVKSENGKFVFELPLTPNTTKEEAKRLAGAFKDLVLRKFLLNHGDG